MVNMNKKTPSSYCASWCKTFIFQLLCCFLLPFLSQYFFVFSLSPSSASLSLSYIHAYCPTPVRRAERLFRVSLWYPAVNPLPSETLPFPVTDSPTDMHTQTPVNAQNMRNNHDHTPTHTLQPWDAYSNLLHTQAWMFWCVGICAYVFS